MTNVQSSVPAVEMTGICKSFGAVQVLQGVDFTVRAGSVHALMGENGAGKSTLLKILRGVHSPDAGGISIFGTKLTNFSPESSRRAGIGMIFQELSLIPTLTVAQNIFLTREPRWHGLFLDQQEANRQAARLLHELGLDVDPRAPVSRLTPGQTQMTEIAKAVSQDARVLVMDEPTAALSSGEVDKLFEFLRRVTAQGVAVVYVSHRMDEIYEVAQEVTVLRDGRQVASSKLSDLPMDALVERMVGKKIHSFAWVERPRPAAQTPLLEARDLHGSKKPNGVSFKLHSGEVLGIAGLLGSGRSELARALFGIDPISSGEILVRGKPAVLDSPQAAIASGLALIPESRHREGLVLSHSVKENLSLPTIDSLRDRLLLNGRRERQIADDLMKRLRIKAASANSGMLTLSGGNQQKVVIGKWLVSDPEVIILDEPTAGVDIGSKSEIVQLIRDLADSGKGIIIISSELAELLAVSDRILIMSDGRIGREIDRHEISGWSDESSGGAQSNDGQRLGAAEHHLQLAIQQARSHVH